MKLWSYLPGQATRGRYFAWFTWWAMVLVMAFVPQLMAVEENRGLSPAVNAYFKQYCYRCHGETMQKGDRRLDRLPVDGRLDDTAVTLLEEALDAVNRGDMPPNKKGVRRPSAEQTRHVVKAMTQFLDDR